MLIDRPRDVPSEIVGVPYSLRRRAEIGQVRPVIAQPKARAARRRFLKEVFSLGACERLDVDGVPEVIERVRVLHDSGGSLFYFLRFLFSVQPP